MEAKNVPLGNHVFDPLKAAAAQESLDLLREQYPEWAKALEAVVKNGATPTEVYYEMLSIVGSHRHRIARRCELAAQALRSG